MAVSCDLRVAGGSLPQSCGLIVKPNFTIKIDSTGTMQTSDHLWSRRNSTPYASRRRTESQKLQALDYGRVVSPFTQHICDERITNRCNRLEIFLPTALSPFENKHFRKRWCSCLKPDSTLNALRMNRRRLARIGSRLWKPKRPQQFKGE